jgi:hypothetical protein
MEPVAIVLLCAYLVLCVVACIFQPKTPLPSLTETYSTLRVENGVEEVLVEGRQPFPLYKKLNLVWWFLNEYESMPPDWYHPGQNFWLRLPSWYMRNPFQNAGNYVFGVCDRNFTVRGLAPALWTTYDGLDPPCTGFKWSIIRLGCLRLPFVSYASASFLDYAGWQPNGFFGIKLNLRNADLQVV